MRTYTTSLGIIGLLVALFALGDSAAFSLNQPVWAAEEDHDEEEEDHAEEEGLRLSAAERAEFGIKVAKAAAGQLAIQVNTPGEVQVNPNLLAHIVPRVSGVARQIHANIGNQVEQDQVLAVLESQELSEMKSAYLVAQERLELAQANFDREETLWNQSISSERVFLEAKTKLAEARIELRVAEQKLLALGFSAPDLEKLSFDNDDRFTHYEIRAPFTGTIIYKHITQGELLKDDSEAFIVADLRSVWVLLTAYQKDLPFLRVGQPVHIQSSQGGPETTGTVDYISPIINEALRTASIRVVLSNPDGQWRPGSFVTATIDIEGVEVPLLVPRSAIQIMEDDSVVFVETDEGFVPQPVQVGRTNPTHAEILDGLEEGQPYVAQGAFILKAQLAKGAFGDGHAH
ncbi:MAG: efflux RND transporter periplasmic adaptor subunit [Candidatus Latescibacteria bacterium]|nr:efflux RND transporter periplasmic adaptor subunit [Candidatus Latescibacterota bacterium]